MTRVPDQTIVAKVKNAVHREAEFNHAEVGCEMRCANTQQSTQHFADLVADLLQVAEAHAVKFVR